MEQLFREPQRQSLLSIIILFVSNVRNFVSAGALTFVVIFLLLKDLIENPFWRISFMITAIALLLLSMLVFAIYKYRNFVFYIDYERSEFHLNQGVFQKKSLSFKIAQIQQVYIERKWLQRVLGLSSLTIEVAGGQSESVSIKALSNGIANILLEELKSLQIVVDKLLPPEFNIKEEGASIIDWEQGASISVDEELSPVTSTSIPQSLNAFEPRSLKIPLSNLVKNALVTRIFRGLVLVFVPLQMLGYDLTVKLITYAESYFSYQIVWGPILIIGMVIVGLVLAIILNLILSVLQYYNLNIKEVEKNQYELSHGLINLKVVRIKTARIQMVVLEQNVLQKIFGLFTMSIKQLESIEQTQHKTGIRIPGINQAQLNELINWGFIPNNEVGGVKLKPLMRKFWIQSLIYTFYFLTIGVIAYINLNQWFMMVLGTLVLIWIVVIVFSYFRVKREQFHYTDQQLWLQSGVWLKKHTLILIPKIQSIQRQHFFWQKRFTHANISTAGGVMRMSFYPQQEWKILEGELLYIIESKNPPWF